MSISFDRYGKSETHRDGGSKENKTLSNKFGVQDVDNFKLDYNYLSCNLMRKEHHSYWDGLQGRKKTTRKHCIRQKIMQKHLIISK